MNVGRIALVVKNHNNVKVLGESRASGKTAEVKATGGTGTANTYKVSWGTPNQENWYPRMFYVKGGNTCTQCIPSSLSASEEAYYKNVVMTDDKIYIKQSNPNSVGLKNKKEVFTMNDIFNEFYDTKTGELTNQTKTLSSGDKIVMKDVIVGLEYNSEYDFTVIKFKSEHKTLEHHDIMFKGDLTNKYVSGDSLNLLFNLEQTDKIDGNVFVETNYNIQVEESGNFPEIGNFILK